jgi:hypothetical protein
VAAPKYKRQYPVKLQFNVQLVSNAQKKTGNPRQTTREVSNAFARMILREVALAMSDKMAKSMTATFSTEVEKVVRKELDNMARAIAKSMIRPEGADGPSRSLTIRSEDYSTMSKTAQSMGWSSNYNVSQAGIKWAPRDKEYVKKKKRKAWWDKTGKLQTYLSRKKGSFYEQAFGPVKVIYQPRRGRMTKYEYTDFGRKKVSSTGARGKLSQDVRVGDVQVIALGNITPNMMPGLSSMTPMAGPPSKNGNGVAGLLADRWYNKHTAKLMGKSTSRRITKERVGRITGYTPVRKKPKFTYARETKVEKLQSEYRPWMDPFVSFYLTRAIPNAVYRRIEREVFSTKGRGRAGS